MIIYILTCASVWTEAGSSDNPVISTKLFLSPLEAQLAMNEQLEKKTKEAESNGDHIRAKDIYQTSAFLSYSNNISNTEVIWDMTQQDIPVSAFSTREPNFNFIKDFVKNNGKPSEDNRIILLMPHGNRGLYIGGYQGANNENVDELILEGEQLTIEAEYGQYGPYDIPADDLQEIRDKLENEADYIKAIQRYYQPELIKTQDVPKGLASFQVFPTKEDCRTWMSRNGYIEDEYEIYEYSGDDIEDPTVLNGNDDIIFKSEENA